jgi:hypothetical protein
MRIHERYFAQALAWSIKTDFEFIRWLVDIRSFPDAAIENDMTRVLYVAAARSYAKIAPTGGRPSSGDVVLELAKTASEVIANTWEQKIGGMSQPELSQARSVAVGMAEDYDKERVVESIGGWLNRIKGGAYQGSIYGQFSSMSDEVVKLLIGDQKTGRPGDILERSWSSRLKVPEPTGYSRIDTALDGGWAAGKFYIMGMPSGHGKSSLCCNFASRRAVAGKPTLINSFEMAADDLLFRMICDLAEVSIDVAENPDGNAASEEEHERVLQAKDLLDAYVRLYDSPADASEIGRRIRRHKVEFQGEIIFTELDHLGIMRRGGRGNEWAEIESMAYALNDLAKAQEVPLLAYSQVPAQMEQELLANNQVFYNRDFRGSRGIRNAVDYAMVGCKHNGLVKNDDGEMEYDYSYANHTALQVIKNRRTGRMFWGVFEYNPVHYRLRDKRNLNTKEDIHA